MAKNKDDLLRKRESLFKGPGPLRIGAGQSGESHLFTEPGRPGYTEGVPYEEEKYVTPVIGEDYAVPTDEPVSVKTGAKVTHMGVPESAPAVESSFPTLITTGPKTVFHGKWKPVVHESAKIDPCADIRGNIHIMENVHIAAGTIISAHENEPMVLSPGCAIFEGAVLTVLPVTVKGQRIASRLVKVESVEYPLYVGEHCVIAPRAQLTGPCYIGHDCFIGAGSHVFWAKIGHSSVIEPGAFVMNVEIPSGYFVPSGLRVTKKESVGKLPKITERYRFRRIAEEMLAEIQSRT